MKLLCAVWLSIAVLIFLALDDRGWGERIAPAIIYGGVSAALITGLLFVWGWALA